MKPEAKWAIGIAVIVALILVITYMWRREHAGHSGNASGFHGWRMQHYDDNPYAGQTYRCGRCAVGYHCPGQREGCPSDCSPAATGPSCPPGCKLQHQHRGHVESFCHSSSGSLCPHDKICPHGATFPHCPQCHTCTEAGVTECLPSHAHVEACDAQGRANARDRCAVREGFGGQDWPVAGGTYGATADTFPYGNFADGEQMFYPTYFDQPQNHYWSRF